MYWTDLYSRIRKILKLFSSHESNVDSCIYWIGRGKYWIFIVRLPVMVSQLLVKMAGFVLRLTMLQIFNDFWKWKLSVKQNTTFWNHSTFRSPLLSIYLYKTSKGALPAACIAIIVHRDFTGHGNILKYVSRCRFWSSIPL